MPTVSTVKVARPVLLVAEVHRVRLVSLVPVEAAKDDLVTGVSLADPVLTDSQALLVRMVPMASMALMV